MNLARILTKSIAKVPKLLDGLTTQSDVEFGFNSYDTALGKNVISTNSIERVFVEISDISKDDLVKTLEDVAMVGIVFLKVGDPTLDSLKTITVNAHKYEILKVLNFNVDGNSLAAKVYLKL